ncbi:early nodulin-like protein 3 [Salvia miltiorrhiza]|uniref:early nodulin-like protein 3 n=1 Tax=Salvia miltiorrhiza TaxID=226208 RepID=UPI0025ABD70E|nr:early nodulin-like protein 3 [Salvia miltiorrhiza]
MAGEQRDCLLFVALFCCLVHFSYSYQFVVGGGDGWVVKPSEDYNQWASRMRFQVNDTLLFKYKSGSDSVLVVDKNDYDSCSVANPLLKLDDGNSIFKFNRSGPFYFISGNKANCDQGQKLIVVVLAIRTPPSPQGSSPPSPSPAGKGGAPGPGPAGSPSQPGGAPAPANSPSSPSPASGAPAPAGSGLGPAPAGSGLGPAPAESGLGPAPAGSGLEPAPSGDLPGSPSSSTTTPGSPGSSTPGSGTPADANSPPAPGGSLAAPSCSTSVFLMSVLTVGLGVFVLSP